MAAGALARFRLRRLIMGDLFADEIHHHLGIGTGEKAGKFADPHVTAGGEPRATVIPQAFRTLWFNTGTLCNLACQGCYIESSPRNDRLAYLSRKDVHAFLAEARQDRWGICEIGFTGGEPFMNPEIVGMLEDALHDGFHALVLTNAMAPMQHRRSALRDLHNRHSEQLALRVSLDHHTQPAHEAVRGRRSWTPALDGLKWLSDNGFDVSVAARIRNGETEGALRRGFAALFAKHKIHIDAYKPHRLVLFPEMDVGHDVPEISERCWGALGKDPSDVMCATSRMVVKRKGEARPIVVSCTLLPYDAQFEMGGTLAEASQPVKLNHPYCAQFCVLGGASCSS